MYNILVFPGDGIGPEVSEQAVKILRKLGQEFHLVFEIQESLLGGASIDGVGTPLSDQNLRLARQSDAVFIGAVGGPKWDHLAPESRPERGLLKIRKSLEVFANLRPVKVDPSLVHRSPLKKEKIEKTDILIVRELIGGIYFGSPRGLRRQEDGQRCGFNTEVYTESEIKRVAQKAFELARRRRRKVTSVDKANVLESGRLWRDIVEEVHRQYQDVQLNHRYVDDCAMQLVRDPGQFDVLVTNNLFGDILSDEAAMLSGSIGMLPSASLGNKHGVYEPIHGSAPDIAGRDIANPLAAILSVAMMMTYSFQLMELAETVEKAVSRVLKEGYRTADIEEDGCQKVSCSKMGDLVAERIKNGF